MSEWIEDAPRLLPGERLGTCTAAHRDGSMRMLHCELDRDHDHEHRAHDPIRGGDGIVVWRDGQDGASYTTADHQDRIERDRDAEVYPGDEANLDTDGDGIADNHEEDPVDDDDDRDWDPEEDSIRTGAERDLARQLREDREAHAAALELEVVDRDLKPENLIAPTGATITCGARVYPVHPAARIFPTTAEQYAKLKESIALHGQTHPIEVLDVDDTVIDGCSRLRACAELGIDPVIKRVTVTDPIAYVAQVNVRRRHLDPSALAIAAANLANMAVGANQHTRGSADLPTLSQAQAAAAIGASERLTRDVVRVRNAAAPAVIEAMESRRITVGAAVEFVKKELDHDTQREIAERVTKGQGDVRAGKVRSLVRQAAKHEILERINTGSVALLPEGPFGLIYGDYPWWYDNSDQHEGARGHMGYPGMRMPEVLAHAREVAARAAHDFILALWFTNLYTREIGAVVDAYGATHHTMWTWPKPRAGIGTWGRGQTEHLIIASRGAPTHTLNEVSTLLPSYALREHSRKPDEVADLLLKHCPGPHLELFARAPRTGWVTWGVEADGAKALEKPKRSKILTATDARMGSRVPEVHGV